MFTFLTPGLKPRRSVRVPKSLALRTERRDFSPGDGAAEAPPSAPYRHAGYGGTIPPE
jgi:hypothetical protein